MKGLIGLILATAIVGFVGFLLYAAVYGLYLAFSASILLGILALIIEPSPLVFGVVMIAWEKNLPEMLVNWLNN